jgi:hypothetical protein
MRLAEFADPNEYTPTATDAEDFLCQLPPIWSNCSADELAPSVMGSRKLRSSNRIACSDALSIGSQLGPRDLGRRRGASQWPTA